MKIKINKLTPEAALPHRKHYNDAGADVYLNDDVMISPGQIKKIPLGWSIEIPDGFMGLLMPRSSMAARGFVATYTPIDPGYRGEVSLMVHNTTSDDVGLFIQGERLAQLVIVPVVYANFVTELEEARGVGGFGSTGK